MRLPKSGSCRSDKPSSFRPRPSRYLLLRNRTEHNRGLLMAFYHLDLPFRPTRFRIPDPPGPTDGHRPAILSAPCAPCWFPQPCLALSLPRPARAHPRERSLRALWDPTSHLTHPYHSASAAAVAPVWYLDPWSFGPGDPNLSTFLLPTPRQWTPCDVCG